MKLKIDLFNLKKLLVFPLVSSFFILSACVQNNTAPDFTLLSTNENAVSLSDYKGKVVFLDFWATWCPPCRASVPAVKELNKTYLGNSDVVILGINSGESVQTVKEFMASTGMDYTVLYATPDTGKDYEVTGIPAFFVIDKNGKIVKRFKGYARGMEQQWKQAIEESLNLQQDI